jgi:hypothetical protein
MAHPAMLRDGQPRRYHHSVAEVSFSTVLSARALSAALLSISPLIRIRV